MYWWHVVNSNKSEVLYKCYQAQKLNINKGDWIEQLNKDKVELDLQLTDEQIQSLSKEKFKSLVKSRIEKSAAKNLVELQNSHTKSENLDFIIANVDQGVGLVKVSDNSKYIKHDEIIDKNFDDYKNEYYKDLPKKSIDDALNFIKSN